MQFKTSGDVATVKESTKLKQTTVLKPNKNRVIVVPDTVRDIKEMLISYV